MLSFCTITQQDCICSLTQKKMKLRSKYVAFSFFSIYCDLRKGEHADNSATINLIVVQGAGNADRQRTRASGGLCMSYAFSPERDRFSLPEIRRET